MKKPKEPEELATRSRTPRVCRAIRALPILLTILFLGLAVSCSEREARAQASEAEMAEAPEHPMVAHLDRIVIPKVEITAASLEEALDFANHAALTNDSEEDPARRRISVVVRRAPNALPAAPVPEINYSAENVRYLDLIAEIARQGRLDAYLTSSGIVLVPEGADPLSAPKAPDEEIWKTIRVATESPGEAGPSGIGVASD